MQNVFDSLLTHLIDLRQKLIRISIVFLIAFAACFLFSESLYNLVVIPLTRVLPHQKLITTGIVSPFLIQIKISAIIAFLLTLPNTLYQVWAFIAPGLYNHEKQLVLPLVISSIILFFLGIAFAYFFVLGVIFHFLLGITPDSMQWLPDSSQYLDFVITLFISFGVTFEVPILVILLIRTGIVTLDQLRSARRYIIVGAFVLAAILTPPDIFSQFMLAIPLWLLYEIGLGICTFWGRVSQSKTANEE